MLTGIDRMIGDQIAQNAIDHPDWKQDDHTKSLRDAGWPEHIISSVSRVIAEAVWANEKLAESRE